MDQQTFTALTQAHMGMVYRLAFHILGSPHDADDVTQEVFLRLLRAGPAFESDEHAKYWLIRVTRNECKRLVRAPWRRHAVALDDLEAVLPWEAPEQPELFQSVLALPPKYRGPLYLFYYEEMSTEQIARALGRSPSTVRTQLSRAREQLRHILKEEWNDD